MLRNIMALIVIAAVFITDALAGITVSPAALYMDRDTQRGRVRVMNTDNVRREVRVTMQFGYPVSDAQGRISLQFFNGETDAQSATGWITAYPGSVELNPGEAQVFVFSAEPPATLNEGEYWARPIIHSTPAGSFAATDTARGFAFALSINYRNGHVETGVNVNDVSARADGNTLAMIIDMTRRGNAAYLGSMVTRIRNRNGRCLFEEQRDVAVYRSLARQTEFAISGLPQGTYVAEVEFNTQRAENAPGDILLAPPVTITMDFTMPDRKLDTPEVTVAGATVADVSGPSKHVSLEDEKIKSLERALQEMQKKQAELVSALSSLKAR